MDKAIITDQIQKELIDALHDLAKINEEKRKRIVEKVIEMSDEERQLLARKQYPTLFIFDPAKKSCLEKFAELIRLEKLLLYIDIEKIKSYIEKIRSYCDIEKIKSYIEKIRSYIEKIRSYCDIEKIKSYIEKMKSYIEKIRSYIEKIRSYIEKIESYCDIEKIEKYLSMKKKKYLEEYATLKKTFVDFNRDIKRDVEDDLDI
jgi:cob(I)alamin adenosyltransferase